MTQRSIRLFQMDATVGDFSVNLPEAFTERQRKLG